MVNNRLTWYLETNNILTELQSGFRRGRSTTDQLVRLESFVGEAIVRGEHATAIFFDMEKAYDTTWKYGILQDLKDAGLRGRLPTFVCNFLSNRKFNVRVGPYLCDTYKQEMGVPQGSVLSVTLFCHKN
jgi:Reverse transcriptase (RNA-dependent DNA polymerase)